MKEPTSGFDESCQIPEGVTLRHCLSESGSKFAFVAWSSRGMLATASRAAVTIWDSETGSSIKTLKKDHDRILTLAWSPDGTQLATGSYEGIVDIWSVAHGEVQLTIRPRTGPIMCLAWSPLGDSLSWSSQRSTATMADPRTGERIRALERHKLLVTELAYSYNAQFLATGSMDGCILWDGVGGWYKKRLLTSSQIYCVGWTPVSNILACGGADHTVKLFDLNPVSPQPPQILEGHTANVQNVCFSANGFFLASRGEDPDNTIRIWHHESWRTVAVLPYRSSSASLCGIAFHPRMQRIAMIAEMDTVVQIWDLDPEGLLRDQNRLPESIRHTTAKIVLVGDSGVGKTGLGWRLTHGDFKEHASTHGYKFWVFNRLGTRRSDGTECEAILWDLAGQPDYRLIHALYLDEADLALVLFDPTDSRDPLHGVEYWLRQLKVGVASCSSEGSGEAPLKGGAPSILVAARCDRGAPTLTHSDLDTFCHRRGLSGWVSTSAKEGDGLEDLIQRMQALIAWETKATTVTTATFKRIKDYVLKWKENRTDQEAIVVPEELRRRLEQTDVTWQFTEGEMMTAVGHLENYGYIRKLTTSQGQTRLLLIPELLNNLAHSFVIEARRNEKGLGALEEKRLFAGEYRFPELECLTPDERTTLLDSATLLFIEHNICFRETDPLNEQKFLIFPELINLNKPAVDVGKPFVDDVAYTVSGAIENVYASLVVLLGYTEKYTRTDQWKNHARYEVGRGMVCGFHQIERDAELEFVLYFGTDVRPPVRRLFQSLFESFLERRNLTVKRFEPVRCTTCGHVLARAVVQDRVRTGKDFAFCEECGNRLSLPKMGEPIQMTREQQVEVEEQRLIAELRTSFEKGIYRAQSYVKARGIKPPECFISYAWGEEQQESWVERNLATDLQKAGIVVILDRWENQKIGASVPRFVERVSTSDCVVVVGTPLYRQKYENGDPMRGFIVAAEGDLIGARMIGAEPMKESVFPALLDGTPETSFPALLQGRVFADFRDQKAYFKTALHLILSVYGIRKIDLEAIDLRVRDRSQD